MGKDGGPVVVDRIVLRVPFWPFAVVTVSLPAFSLAICFVTAYIFRFDDVNETMCEVSTTLFLFHCRILLLFPDILRSIHPTLNPKLIPLPKTVRLRVRGRGRMR